MIKKESSNVMRKIRHTRVRNKIAGTSEVPRLNVFRSNNNIFAQIIDDEKQTTLVSSSSVELKINNGGNVEGAKLVGADIAKKAKKAKITKVVFDRGGYLYHGRVKALAEAAREAGLEFCQEKKLNLKKVCLKIKLYQLDVLLRLLKVVDILDF